MVLIAMICREGEQEKLISYIQDSNQVLAQQSEE